MKKIVIISSLAAALLFAGCGRKSESEDAPSSELTAMTAPALKISAEYESFARSADSLLNTLDAQIEAYDAQFGNPGRRRHVVRQHREVIQAQYRLDKLRERLQKRSRSYKAAVEELNRITNDNPNFIRHYEDDLQLLESKVAVLLKDTLH